MLTLTFAFGSHAPRKSLKRLISLGLAITLASTAIAQEKPQHTSPRLVSPPKIGKALTPTNELPKALRVCAQLCSTWTSSGDQFFIQGAKGGPVPVKVESFTTDSVILRRTDGDNAATPGLQALYIGKQSAHGISGKATFIPTTGNPWTLPFAATWEGVDPTYVEMTPSPVFKDFMAARNRANDESAKMVMGLFLLMAAMSDDTSNTSGEDTNSVEYRRYHPRNAAEEHNLAYCGSTLISCPFK